MTSPISRISQLDAHHRLWIAVGTAAIAFISIPGRLDWLLVWPLVYPTDWPVRLTVTWIIFALTVLVLTWITIVNSHPRDLPRLSRLQDSSRKLILAFVITAAVASLFAVIAVLDSMCQTNRAAHSTLAILAVSSA